MQDSLYFHRLAVTRPGNVVGNHFELRHIGGDLGLFTAPFDRGLRLAASGGRQSHEGGQAKEHCKLKAAHGAS